MRTPCLRVRSAVVLAVLALLAIGAPVQADVILSATAVNDTLKKMQRLRQTLASASGSARGEPLFQLGVEADALASLINDEVAAHGSQEKPLIDLAVSRTRELGVLITYDAGKKKFFYDNAAFREYLGMAPRSAHAAEAAFKLIEGDFFRSAATDTDAILAAAERKRAFLRQHRAFAAAVDVHMMLSVDYRDLYRHYLATGNAANRDRYRDLARQQLRLLMKSFPDSEQAEIARRMLQRFDQELRGSP